MLLYSLLHLTGYDLSLGELKRYRQWGSRAPGKEVLGRYGFTVENVVARVLGLLSTPSKGGVV